MREPARTLLEAVAVGALALGAGLVANAVNPDGLSLTRDHFRTAAPVAPTTATLADAPGGHAKPVGAPVAGSQAKPAAVQPKPIPQATPGPTPAGAAEVSPATAPAAGPDGEASDAATQAVIERLLQHGLQVVTHAEARALFEDPAYAAGAYVFVDARGDDAYRAGHVPGAVQFDRFHPERHVADVTAACAGALKVIVYCIGVNCEDSEMAAQDLPALGVDARLVHVYAGGYTAWTSAGLPIEKGKRGGGDG